MVSKTFWITRATNRVSCHISCIYYEKKRIFPDQATFVALAGFLRHFSELKPDQKQNDWSKLMQ
ncbi:hypothetical protein L579_4544 [Pantoea sp. AS-PWVM4]|nr:hypothetical protein L579_4544 [Pantoea sp. AS-PWVM4]